MKENLDNDDEDNLLSEKSNTDKLLSEEITLPENVTEVIKQQKINTLYDLLSKSSNSSEKNTEFKKIS